MVVFVAGIILRVWQEGVRRLVAPLEENPLSPSIRVWSDIALTEYGHLISTIFSSHTIPSDDPPMRPLLWSQSPLGDTAVEHFLAYSAMAVASCDLPH